MVSFWEWSLDAKVAAIVAVGFAVWAVYGYIRYGLDDPPRNDASDGGEPVTKLGRVGLDTAVGACGCLATAILLWVAVVGILVVWSALGR